MPLRTPHYPGGANRSAQSASGNTSARCAATNAKDAPAGTG